MSESDTGAAVIEPLDDVNPESAGVEETDDAYFPPFRPIPAPTRRPLHQRYRKWMVGCLAWAVLVGAAYSQFAGADQLNYKLTFSGLVLGFLVGLTGMGGGALMTPLLILIFKVPPTTAVGTDITYAAVTKIFGSWRHFKQGSVDLPLALWLAAGSVPASLLGVSAINYIKNNYGDKLNNILYWSIGSALIFVSAVLVIKVVMHVDQKHRRENIPMPLKRKLLTIALGALCGFIIGLTSVGSGTFLAVCLILFFPLATDRIVGTDVFHAMILLCITAVAQRLVGNVDLWMVASLLMGSVPAVIVGSRLTVKAPTRVLRVCLAAVLYLSGMAMLWKIGVNIPLIAAASAAGIAALVVVLVLFNRHRPTPADA
jgi:uncharacterized membrane protein YfcA